MDVTIRMSKKNNLNKQITTKSISLSEINSPEEVDMAVRREFKEFWPPNSKLTDVKEKKKEEKN